MVSETVKKAIKASKRTEREGFEPSVPLNGVRVLSRDVPSAAQPSFRENLKIRLNLTGNRGLEQGKGDCKEEVEEICFFLYGRLFVQQE